MAKKIDKKPSEKIAEIQKKLPRKPQKKTGKLRETYEDLRKPYVQGTGSKFQDWNNGYSKLAERGMRKNFRKGTYNPYNTDFALWQDDVDRFQDYGKIGLENYSAGGILKDVAMGAGTGALAGTAFPIPFLGNAAGAVVGGLVGLGKGLIGHFGEKKAERAEQAQQNREAKRISGMQNEQFSINPYTATMPFGGKIPFGANAELEKQEVMQAPGGDMSKVDGPSHAQGGVPVSAQPGTRVYSDRLKFGKKTYAQIADDLGKKLEKAKEVVDNKKSNDLDRTTAEKNLKNIQAQLDILFAKQESLKPAQQGVGQSGLPQHGLGEIISGIGGFIGKNKELLGGIANTVGQLAPIGYNIAQGMKPTEEMNPQDFYNPYGNQAMDLMANRRMDVNPMLRANEAAYGAASGNLKSVARGRGELMGNQRALMSGRQQADYAVRAQKQNTDNAYLGEQAQFMAGLGSERAQTKLGVTDLNARNQAAGRNFLGAAAGQMGDFFQNQQQMGNQRRRDKDFLPQFQAYMDMLGLGKGKGFKPKSSFNKPNLSFDPSELSLNPYTQQKPKLY